MNTRELIAQLEFMLREGIISEADNVTIDTYDTFNLNIKAVESRKNEVVFMTEYPPLED